MKIKSALTAKLLKEFKTTLFIKEALLNDGKMEKELYEYELEELVEELKESLAEDDDDFIFSVTEHSGHVAMLLIEPSGKVYINEAARSRLKRHWKKAYKNNILKLIPGFVKELKNGKIAVNGVKKVDTHKGF